VNRLDLQQLAEERLLALQSLILSKNWPSAYYLAGYAVELGLKACVLVRLTSEPELVFDRPKAKFAESCWTHRINDLLELAGLAKQKNVDSNQTVALGTNWQRVSFWTESSRYEMKTQVEAEELYNAITDAQAGVMPWLRIRW